MRKFIRACVVAAMTFHATASGAADGVIVTYSGFVDAIDAGLVGTIAVNDPVTGSFLFDPNRASPRINPSQPNAIGYGQAIRDFALTLGGYSVSYATGGDGSDTFMGITNDGDYGPGVLDVMSARVGRPSLDGSPVNGAILGNTTVVLATQDLSVLSSPALPTAGEINGISPATLSTAILSSASWILASTGNPTQVFRAYWQITTLSATTVPIPEPSTALLFGIGLAGISFRRATSHQRRRRTLTDP